MNAWLFYLNSNDYYVNMLISAYKDLQDTNTKYPVYCAITKNVDSSTCLTLSTIGINLIELDTTLIDDCKFIKSQKYKESLEWYKKAFYKLAILSANFEATFDKIVYLDLDIQILKNIDEVMDKPHMSAVINRAPEGQLKPYQIGQSNFCSGLLVWDFKNNHGLGTKLLNSLNTLDDKISWHDQNVFNFWYKDWIDKPELHLPPIYGLMNHADIYNKLADKSDLKIIHFVSRERNNWPFLKLTNVPKKWCLFKEWVKHISDNCKYFTNTYGVHILPLYPENIKIF